MRWGYAKKFQAGDVIGCFLDLSEMGNDKTVTDYEDPLWAPGLLCDFQFPPEPQQLIGSSIEWSINGERYDRAFVNIVEGAYYPAVSLYNKAKVKVNFGPHFKFAPKEFNAIANLFDPASHLKPPKRPPTFIPRGVLAQQYAN